MLLFYYRVSTATYRLHHLFCFRRIRFFEFKQLYPTHVTSTFFSLTGKGGQSVKCSVIQNNNQKFLGNKKTRSYWNIEVTCVGYNSVNQTNFVVCRYWSKSDGLIFSVIQPWLHQTDGHFYIQCTAMLYYVIIDICTLHFWILYTRYKSNMYRIMNFMPTASISQK